MPGIAASTPFFAHKTYILGFCTTIQHSGRLLVIPFAFAGYFRIGNGIDLGFFFWNLGGLVHFIQFLCAFWIGSLARVSDTMESSSCFGPSCSGPCLLFTSLFESLVRSSFGTYNSLLFQLRVVVIYYLLHCSGVWDLNGWTVYYPTFLP